MEHLKNMAMAGELCLQEAILIALEKQSESGLSVREIAGALELEGTGCENMLRSHLEHRLQPDKKVERAPGRKKPAWMLTKEERARRGG